LNNENRFTLISHEIFAEYFERVPETVRWFEVQVTFGSGKKLT